MNSPIGAGIMPCSVGLPLDVAAGSQNRKCGLK